MKLLLTSNDLYEVASNYVDLVNDPFADAEGTFLAGEALDRACHTYARQNGIEGDPLGRLREAAMNGWPLTEADEEALLRAYEGDSLDPEDEPQADENGWTAGWWAGGTAFIHECGYIDPTGDAVDENYCPRCNTEAPPSEPQPFDDDLPF